MDFFLYPTDKVRGFYIPKMTIGKKVEVHLQLIKTDLAIRFSISEVRERKVGFVLISRRMGIDSAILREFPNVGSFNKTIADLFGRTHEISYKNGRAVSGTLIIKPEYKPPISLAVVEQMRSFLFRKYGPVALMYTDEDIFNNLKRTAQFDEEGKNDLMSAHNDNIIEPIRHWPLLSIKSLDV